jgi:transcriptional regulator with XRE-family HTH domain
MSQEELADAADTDLTQVGGIERGVRNPSYTTLLRLATALETTVGELTTLADELRDA